MEQIEILNSYINHIIEITFESNTRVFSEKEKENIKKYFAKVLEKSVSQAEKSPSFKNLVRTLTKVKKYSIKGRVEDTEFLMRLCQEHELIKKIELYIQERYLESENIEDIENLEELLTILIEDNFEISDIIRKSFEVLKCKKSDIYHSAFMKKFLEKFTEIFAIVRITESDRGVFEVIYEYIDNITKDKQKFNLYNEQGISDILQILERMEEGEYKNKILEILELNLNISKTDISELKNDIYEFIEKSEGVMIEETAFDEFLKNVQELKLANNFRIDDKIIKFILQQFLKDESIIFKNKEKYKGVIERIIEDFARNDVLRNTNIPYIYFIRDVISQQSSAAELNEKLFIAILKRETIQEYLIKNKDLMIFGNIYHENVHAEQYKDLNSGNISNNHLRYIQKKEEIIKKYNPEYYIANYNLMFQEIEAREISAKRLEKLIIDLDEDKQQLEKQRKIQMIEKENYKKAEYKKERINSDTIVNFYDYFDSLVLKHPEIIKENPELKREYDENGKPKSKKEILKDIKENHEIDS